MRTGTAIICGLVALAATVAIVKSDLPTKAKKRLTNIRQKELRRMEMEAAQKQKKRDKKKDSRSKKKRAEPLSKNAAKRKQE